MNRLYKQAIGVVLVLLAAAGGLALLNSRLGQGRDPRRVSQPDYLATIETDYGNITIHLYTNEAPNTVATFVSLVRQKFYDGLSFTVVNRDDGVIAAGIPPKGHEPKWFVTVEENDLKVTRGAVAMFDPSGNGDRHQTAFLISAIERPHLQGFLTVMGYVVEGMDTVERILQVDTTGPEGKPAYHPLEPVIIKRITVRKVS